jgi:hypothetical protein
MNQSLMDPKLIGLAAVVIVVIAVHSYASDLDRSTSGRCERTGPNAEPKRSWPIVRSGSEP